MVTNGLISNEWARWGEQSTNLGKTEEYFSDNATRAFSFATDTRRDPN